MNVAEIFSHVRNLPLRDMRQLRDWIDGVVQFLERPQRAEQIDRAVRAAGPYYIRWRDASVEAAIAKRLNDQEAAVKHLAVAQQAREDLNMWLNAEVPQLSKLEMASVLARIQQEAEETEQEG
jgi:UDP:flavonoid glycosyltransferase YjiC (YdhE family)